MSASDNVQSAFNYFVSQGMSPIQAAGIVGNLQGESGQSLDPSAVSRGDGRDGSDSIGIAQWNGARAQALKDYAASKGVPWSDLNTQLEFLHSELRGPEGSAYKSLQGAQTPEDAAQAMLSYERPKDWNKPGAHPERARYAKAVFASYGGQPAGQPGQQTAQAAPEQQQPAVPTLPQLNAPIFAAAAQSAPQIPTAAPPAFAQRPQIDLSGLRAALAQYQQQPIFART